MLAASDVGKKYYRATRLANSAGGICACEKTRLRASIYIIDRLDFSTNLESLMPEPSEAKIELVARCVGNTDGVDTLKKIEQEQI